MNIKKLTRVIIEKDGEYLVGVSIVGQLRWSTIPYDAWHTRDRIIAHKVAWKVKGIPYLFNPAVGQIRKL